MRAFRVIVDAAVPAEGPPTIDPVPDPAAVTAALELAAWEAASRTDEVAAYLDFLERYPDGDMAGSARHRIAALSKSTAEPIDAGTAVELTYWKSVEDSDNPAMFQAYLEQYPDGSFVALARAKLDELAGRSDGA